VTTMLARHPALAAGIVIGPVMALASLLGGGSPIGAMVSLAIVLGYAVVVTLLGRRGDTFAILAGRPEDERAMHLNEVASTWAFGITAVVALGGVVVGQATGGPWGPFALIAVVMAIAYAGSLVVLRFRS
jgi:uncharacterized membrane protein